MRSIAADCENGRGAHLIIADIIFKVGWVDGQGHPSVIVSVRALLPLIGMIGLDSGLEVSGHAAVEELE